MPGAKYEAMRIEVDDDGDEIEVLVKEVSEEWGGHKAGRPPRGNRWSRGLTAVDGACLSHVPLSRHRQGGHVCVYDATVQEGSVMGIKGEKR